MQVSVLSGKGGTGKTTVAVNLAKVMDWRYVDCDVEEPNGFIFLKPKVERTLEVEIPVPVIDRDKCVLCKKCVDICQFHALGMTKERVVTFEKMCHGCGACSLICPEGAITERGRVIGTIETGFSGSMECLRGVLNVGEPMAGPIIRKLKDMVGDQKTTVIDCSPGSSCSVVKAITGSDFALLVTEPTKFGLHDLEIAVSLVRQMKIPFGIVLNRADEYENMITGYCKKENIPLVGIIPFDKNAARWYSEGRLLIEDSGFRSRFAGIAGRLMEVAGCS